MKTSGQDLKDKLLEQGLLIVVRELTRDAMRNGLPQLKEKLKEVRKKIRKYDSDDETLED